MSNRNSHAFLTLAACALLCSCSADAPPEAASPAEVTADAQVAAETPERAIVNITDDLYRVQNGTHFTVFVVSSEGIILADPINRDAAQWLSAELDERFGLPVRYVLYSHSHWDHASGAAVFADTATLVGHANMRAEIESARQGLPTMVGIVDANGNGAMDRDEASGELARNFSLFDRNSDGRINGAELMADVVAPELTYDESLTIVLGEKIVRIVHPGPNHSSDMSVLLFPDEGVIYGVDFVNVNRLAFGFPGTGTTDEWIASLRRVEALDFDTVAPGHSGVGTKADFIEYLEFFEALDAGVDGAIAAGLSLDAFLASDALNAYAHMPNFEPQRDRNIEAAWRVRETQLAAVPERQNIVVYGASGRIGSLIVAEALERGHQVTGVSRNPAALGVDHAAFSAIGGDVTDIGSYRNLTAGADAVIIASGGSFDTNHVPENSVQARSAATAARALSNTANAPYVLQIGGASTFAPDVDAMLSMFPQRPPQGSEAYGNIVGHWVALEAFRRSDMDWTVLTPPMDIRGWTFGGITDTQSIGSYRTATRGLVRDADGENGIFVADLAAAAVDEIEQRRFIRQRFTVGY